MESEGDTLQPRSSASASRAGRADAGRRLEHGKARRVAPSCGRKACKRKACGGKAWQAAAAAAIGQPSLAMVGTANRNIRRVLGGGAEEAEGEEYDGGAV